MKAVNLQKHLKDNKSDNRNRRSLELIEAKVHRISTHYKKEGKIPETWKYKSVVAKLEYWEKFFKNILQIFEIKSRIV